MRFSCLIATALVLVAGTAAADTREHQKAELQRFERYAGDPVAEFPMFDLWQWQVVGRDRVVLWSTIKDAWLIRVDKGCNNLEWTHGLSVTQNMRQKVSQKFDFIEFRDQRCKIEEIRPVDYRKMIKEGRATEPPKKE